MGSYNFRWEQPATEVYVTGTFDNWNQSVKLDKKHIVHEKLVGLSIADKIFFKYVVDGEWKLDPTHPTEEDHRGNTNNVLYPDELGPPMPGAHPVISSVASGATSASMAGKQPLERRPTEDLSNVPGAFPETPAPTSSGDDEKRDGLAAAAGVGGIVAAGAAALGLAADKDKSEGDQTFSVNPIPASEGVGNPIQLAPGEKVPDPSSFGSNTLTSKVHDDPDLVRSGEDGEQTFGVAPIPATGGIGNPIQLAPGEKVPDPSSLGSNTLTSKVHDDPDLVGSREEGEQTFGVAPIPATGGMGNPIHLQPGEPVPDPSTITGSTLDSNVKLDQASYEKADSGAPVLPPPLSPQSEAEAAGASIFGLGPQTTNMIPESSLPMGNDMPPSIAQADLGPTMSSAAPTSTTAQLAGQVPLEPRREATVIDDSQEQAHAEPENGSKSNAGVAAAVGGGVAAVGASVGATAAALREKTHETTGTDPVSVLPQSVQDSIDGPTTKPDTATPAATTSATETATAVPSEVTESQKAAHVEPEASANPQAVQEKKATENELLQKVQETQTSGEPAPTATAATSATAPGAQTSSSGAPQLGEAIVGGSLAPISMDDKTASGSKELNAPADAPATVAAAKHEKPSISRDVSPKTQPHTLGQTQPMVTTGIDSSSAPAVSSPKNKRHSFFGKSGGALDSQSRPGTAGTDMTSGKTKKKGIIAKIKEKLHHHRE